MLTAKEFVLNENDGYLAGDYTPNEVYRIMIGFAKMHVEAALKAASESRCINMYEKTWFTQSLEPGTKILDRVNITVYKDSILNAYPLNDIK